MQLILQNLEKDVHQKLQELAQSHGRSLEEEVREIIRNAVVSTPPLRGRLGSLIVDRFSGSGITMDEEITELRGHPVVPPDLEA